MQLAFNTIPTNSVFVKRVNMYILFTYLTEGYKCINVLNTITRYFISPGGKGLALDC